MKKEGIPDLFLKKKKQKLENKCNKMQIKLIKKRKTNMQVIIKTKKKIMILQKKKINIISRELCKMKSIIKEINMKA